MMAGTVPAARDNPEWMAGYTVGAADARAGAWAQMQRMDEAHGATWHRGYLVGRQVDRPVAAPAGWPSLIVASTVETFMRTTTATWPRPPRWAASLAVGAAVERLQTRSGRRRAGRLGYTRMGDLTPIDPLVSILGPTLAATTARLVWWRLRHGRAEMPEPARTAPRELARGAIVRGIQRLEWDRLMR